VIGLAEPSSPYGLLPLHEREARGSALRLTHMTKLTAFVRRIRRDPTSGGNVPDFDPLDGGERARVLVLLEAPGRKAVATGFISRDNPDPTAANFFRVLKASQLPRRDTVLWNIVPWYIGTPDRIRAAHSSDVEHGRMWLRRLLSYLPRLDFIVLVGAAAQTVHPWLSTRTAVRILACHHPSPKVFNRWPDRRRENVEAFRYIRSQLTARSSGRPDSGQSRRRRPSARSWSPPAAADRGR